MGYLRKTIEEARGYVPGEQPQDASYVKLNTNENPYPPSPKALEAARTTANEWLRKYPDPLANPVREVVAKLFHVTPEMVVCGNGSDELLAMAVRAFVDPGTALATSDPTYSLYETLASLHGAELESHSCKEDFSLPVDELAASKAPLVVLSNPNAPTGVAASADDLATIAGSIPGVLLVDEAYVDFADEDAMALARSEENVLVLRTLSKSYSLAGLRFGFLVGPSKLAAGIMKLKDSYNCDRLSIATAEAALQDQAYMQKNVAKIRQERQRLTEELRKLGFDVPESRANFVFARPPKGTAGELYMQLKGRGILVRYFDKPRVKEYVRITVGTPDEVTTLLTELVSLFE